MIILGIETSCDETAVAVVRNGKYVLSNVVASQIDIHAQTGGVVPEVAAREHVAAIKPVIQKALSEANLKLEQIDAFAYTRGPGLMSSLTIGFCAARALSFAMSKPLIPVNHISGHIHSNWLEKESPVYPLIVLTVSGGHNELILIKEDKSLTLLGETLDDAAGEAFDKVARLLDLGYPGGPAISKAAENGNPSAIAFPRAMLKSKNYDFSFSGLKTSVLEHVKKTKNEENFSKQYVFDCAASFQECVCDILSEKLLNAARRFSAREVHLAGGVSANKRLKEMTAEKIAKYFNDNIVLKYSDLAFCTDNAAMIAGKAHDIFNSSDYKKLKEKDYLPDPQFSIHKKND